MLNKFNCNKLPSEQNTVDQKGQERVRPNKTEKVDLE